MALQVAAMRCGKYRESRSEFVKSCNAVRNYAYRKSLHCAILYEIISQLFSKGIARQVAEKMHAVTAP